MGYCTDFSGEFTVNKPLDDETAALMNGLNETRRMKRDITKLAKRLGVSKKEAIEKYGNEGQLYCNLDGDCGQSETDDIIDYNTPPSDQPGLWCQWQYDAQSQTIEWDSGEKFYNYIEWIEYLIKAILEPRGYKLNGTVHWWGEEYEDRGNIEIADNKVTVKYAYTYYLTAEEGKKVDMIVQEYLNHDLKELIDIALEDK